MRNKTRTWLSIIGLLVPWYAIANVELDTVEQQGLERISEGQAAQAVVDNIAQNTQTLTDQYRTELKLVNGLETYIDMLQAQLQGQAAEVSTLQHSIGEVAVIERQILPLMLRMLDGLEAFITLDMPFLAEERKARVERLRVLLRRSDVAVAEKVRRVFEAYQVENDYGRTIESYKAKLMLDDASFDAEFLRVGRVGLMYRTVGADRLGFWNVATGSWQDLPDSPYRRTIEQGLRVARQEVAPELVTIPLNHSQVRNL